MLCWAPAAWAQQPNDSTRNAARSLAVQGKDALDSKDYPRAADLFKRAYTLVPAPTLALYEAQALVKLGRLVEADEAYVRAARTTLDARSPELFRQAVQDAEAEGAALELRIPKVTIVVVGPGGSSADLTVEVDGKAVQNALLGVEMPIDPGDHVVATITPGGQRSETPFSIREQERKRVEVQALSAVDEAAPVVAQPVVPELQQRDAPGPAKPVRSWQKPAAYVAGGIGVAGVATGIVTGLLAASHHAKAETGCPGRVCSEGSAGAADLESFRTLRAVSTIGYIVGGVGLAAGVTLFVIAPSKAVSSSSAALWVRVSASGAGVSGAF